MGGRSRIAVEVEVRIGPRGLRRQARNMHIVLGIVWPVTSDIPLPNVVARPATDAESMAHGWASLPTGETAGACPSPLTHATAPTIPAGYHIRSIGRGTDQHIAQWERPDATP